MATDTSNPARLSDALRRDIARRLLAATTARRVVLFGSHAWGNPDVDSDIDLLLVMSEDSDAGLDQARRAHAALRGLRHAFDIVLTTEDRLLTESQVPGSLLHKIVFEGEVLHA